MSHTLAFLDLLDPDAESFLFSCFDYRKEKKGRNFFGTLTEYEPELTRLNKDVFCIYVGINETKTNSRKLADIVKCRAIWVEDDTVRDSPRKDFPIPPSMVVESSLGKYHYYWLTETDKFDEWNAVMATMVNDWGCDIQAKDLSRVMRLPGFNHRKDLEHPFKCRIVEAEGFVYTWEKIKEKFPPVITVNLTPNQNKSDYSEDEAIRTLMNSENYHGNLVSISMSLTNRGVSRQMQLHTLRGLMDSIPHDKRRKEWAHRAGDQHLLECIDTALKKVESEIDEKDQEDAVNVDDVPDFEQPEIIDDKITFPPGMAGDLCKEIYESSPYPNKAISLAAGVGILGGVLGRRYNVSGTGLNIYISVMGRSGLGKAAAKNSISRLLRGGGGPMNIGGTFLGPARFTGPKAIFDTLSNGMSRICVMEEAGLMGASQAGDGAGITRALLDLFTSSGYGEIAGNEAYSNSDNSIKVLNSPALSVINVSTPESFLQALSDKKAETSGEIARNWMLKTNADKPKINRSQRKNFSVDLLKRFNTLIKECQIYQDPDNDLKVVDVKIPEHIYDDADKWVELENKYYKEGDILRSTICSRAFIKVLKIAGCVSIFNGYDCIGEEEYKWAKTIVMEEVSFVSQTFDENNSNDISSIIQHQVIPSMVSMLKGTHNNKKAIPKELARANGIFSLSNATYALGRNKVIKEIDDDVRRNNPRTGLEKVMAFLLRNNYIVKIDETVAKKYGYRTTTKLYRITTQFKALIAEASEYV